MTYTNSAPPGDREMMMDKRQESGDDSSSSASSSSSSPSSSTSTPPPNSPVPSTSSSKRQRPPWTMPSKEGKMITGLRVNNSMTGNKVEFVPQEGRKVKWYGCGPTVYDSAHMGHARTYVSFDILRRIFEDYFGYDVVMVMNITDIDDKIIQRANDRKIAFSELAKQYETEFFIDMKALNVRLPCVVTRVSEYISEVIDFIQKIVDKGFAYESPEGNGVYFDVKKFDDDDRHFYGRMEPSSVNDQNRVLEGEGELGEISKDKKSPFDFALWKKAKRGEPSWPSPWGDGRPGWHIECSAMASSILGFPLDIHSGGIDLRFPHHDNELAQSEAAYHRPQWCNYFLHSGHLHIHGSKMSKSLKNFITIKQYLEVYGQRHIRLLCLMNRWDSMMNYSPGGETMQAAVDVDRSFMAFFSLMKSVLKDTDSGVKATAGDAAGEADVGARCSPSSTSASLSGASYCLGDQRWEKEHWKVFESYQATKDKVHECLLDNFNTSEALVALQRLMSELNAYVNQHPRASLRLPLVKEASLYIFKILRIFGLVVDDAEDFDYSAGVDGEKSSEKDIEPFIKCIGEFRREVREEAQKSMKRINETMKKKKESGDAVGDSDEFFSAVLKESMKRMLGLCDVVRDEKLVDCGVQLEDRADGSFIGRRVAMEELMKERKRKKEEDERKQEIRRQQELQLAEQRKKMEEESKIPPSEFFNHFYKDQNFSEFDQNGIPLKNAENEEISKSQRKAMQKALEKHRKLHEQWLEGQRKISG